MKDPRSKKESSPRVERTSKTRRSSVGSEKTRRRSSLSSSQTPMIGHDSFTSESLNQNATTFERHFHLHKCYIYLHEEVSQLDEMGRMNEPVLNRRTTPEQSFPVYLFPAESLKPWRVAIGLQLGERYIRSEVGMPKCTQSGVIFEFLFFSQSFWFFNSSLLLLIKRQ